MKVKVTIKATVFLEYSDEEKEISAVVDKEVADKIREISKKDPDYYYQNIDNLFPGINDFIDSLWDSQGVDYYENVRGYYQDDDDIEYPEDFDEMSEEEQLEFYREHFGDEDENDIPDCSSECVYEIHPPIFEEVE